MKFADKLKELREAHSVSREDLAQKSGVGRGAIRDYEQGKRMPSLESAVKLAKALGVTCEAFASCEDVIGAEGAGPAKGSRRGAKAKLDLPYRRELPELPTPHEPPSLPAVGKPQKPKRPRGRPKKGK